MQAKIKKIIDIIFIICVFMFIGGSLVKSIIKPINVIERENRYANKYESISISKFLNNNIQTNIENTLADQILISGKLKSANNYFKGNLVKFYIDKYFKNANEYIYLSDVNFYGSTMVYKPIYMNNIKGDLNKKITNYNELISSYKNVDFYAYYIEKDTDIDFDTNQKTGVFDFLKSNLNVNNISKFEINNIKDFNNYFYRTDHHWNYRGSYKGYTEVMNLLGFKNYKQYEEEVCLGNDFSGSKAMSSIFNKVITEPFCVYKFDFENLDITINGEKKDYGLQSEYISNSETTKINYGNFYGWDEGEVIFQNNNSKTKDNIIIIGESYDNAILKLLAESFNTTISIDLRNYEHYMNKKFNINEYINKYQINKALFIGNLSFYTSEDFIIK